MGGKWKVHRCDAMDWSFEQFKDTEGRGVLVVEIISQKMFRKEFLKRIPGVTLERTGFNHGLTFIRPIQGLSLHLTDCYLVMTRRAPLRYGITLRCWGCKEEYRGKSEWRFAENPAEPPASVTVTD